MMKRYATVSCVALFLAFSLHAQNESVNVISYYAVANSLDGQLMIEMTNVLRFYPVFAMRDSIDRVEVTIYYGGNRYVRKADSFDGKRYWEVLLPLFKLGEAIQRIEVEVHFKFDERFVDRFRLVRGLLVTLKKMDGEIARASLNFTYQLSTIQQEVDEEKKPEFAKSMKESNALFEKLGISSTIADKLRKKLQEDYIDFPRYRDSVILVNKINLQNSEVVELLVRDRLDLLQRYSAGYRDIRRERESILHRRDSIEAARSGIQQDMNRLLDSAKAATVRDIEIGLTDTLYSGPSIRKSDVIIDGDFAGARILYRNYKTSLRYMPALDPAERMGIFRIRYVPFPIVGTPGSPSMNLLRPLSNKSPTVFEVGLAFGDAIVPGDELVVPEFSWRRLGFAFAITEKLFADSAEVIGLALTYDFNSYGSIGIGGNFARNEVHGYASLGINKKAFEAVIKVIASVFK